MCRYGDCFPFIICIFSFYGRPQGRLAIAANCVTLFKHYILAEKRNASINSGVVVVKKIVDFI